MTNETHSHHGNHGEDAASKYGTPAAIVIAGALIALALYMSGSHQLGNAGAVADKGAAAPGAALQPGSASLDKMSPVTSADHIQGSINAPVKIVEYSDTECPFCQRFHNTLTQLMASSYGTSGKVAWVYRDFPLAQLHPRSPKESEALECATEEGGNAKFWAYMNRLEAVTPANNGLDPAQLPVIAQFIGLDVSTFNTCLSSGKYAAKVSASIAEAVSTGGNGTPWSIITANGKKFPLSGAVGLPQLESAIDQALATK